MPRFDVTIAGELNLDLMSSLYLQRALLPDMPELFRRVKAAGLTISLDTNDDPQDLWDGGLKNLLCFQNEGKSMQ